MSLIRFTSLVIATHNRGKIKEFSDLLSPYFKLIKSSVDLDLSEPNETGHSFVENAILKAESACAECGQIAIADDSGLEVEALDGRPGIYSARWAGDNKDFYSAMSRIHTELGDHENKKASFICALALAFPDGAIKTFEGKCEGHIIWPPRGDKGFGYDPIFQPISHQRCFAEMSSDEKHAISHRAQAIGKLMDYLNNFGRQVINIDKQT